MGDAAVLGKRGEQMSQCLDGPATWAAGAAAELREVLSGHSSQGAARVQGPAGWGQKITAMGPHKPLCRTPGLNIHMGSGNYLTLKLGIH